MGSKYEENETMLVNNSKNSIVQMLLLVSSIKKFLRSKRCYKKAGFQISAQCQSKLNL